MGIREFIHRRRGIVGVLALLACSSAIAAIVVEFSGPSNPRALSGKQFLTIDDGKTWYVDDWRNLPPVMHEGRPAVGAQVFICPRGSKAFVGYLVRYTAEGKRLMLQLRQKEQQSRAEPGIDNALLQNMEIKRPGDAAWIRASDVAHAGKIFEVRCPGQNDPADPVIP